ncbi:hypothetical protein JOC95_002009 [Bacillus tianshenii]|uniref:NERD domain-containing protein n=1 Tax=Sutcliffiella tianshenii TaxID=1463404 RepID=A0ABS2NZM6_9BACI|nr:hypothetical protein [Bacillus tianshenii]
MSHSEVFGYKASFAEIKQDIRSIDLDEALLILSQFTVLDKKSKEKMKENLKQFVIDKELVDSFEIFDVSNLMYTMKWFIAYGTRNSFYSFNNKHSKPFNVFLTVLKVTDAMINNIDNSNDVQGIVLKESLFLRNTEIDRSLLRQHIMFQEIAKKKELFQAKDYIDIHKIYEEKYGYSISEYVSTIFALNTQCIKGRAIEEIIQEREWGIDPIKFFDKIKIKDKAISIYDSVSIDPLELREWARETINNPYDFEKLLVSPIFIYNNLAYPCSPGNMNAVIFDGLFFKIRNCFGSRDISFFDFFGKLFELYVSDLLKVAVENSQIDNYDFIDEFSFGKNMSDRSSDAYILLGKSLLVVECKSGRIRRETKLEADEKTTDEDFKKYAIEPVKQANKAYTEIVKNDKERFKGANKVTILSVSLQSFPRLPNYNESFYDSEWRKELHPTVKQCDYIGLGDIELIAYIIEKFDMSIFRFIQTKISTDNYIPYANYFYKKYGEIRRLESHNEKLKEVFMDITNTLGFEK